MYGVFAFVWENGAMRRLEGPHGPTQATADAITDDGVIAGRLVERGVWRLARWGAGGIGVAEFPDGHGRTGVVAASAPGQVLAWSSDDAESAIALTWDGASVRTLDHLTRHQWSVPAAMNDRGHAVGRSTAFYAEPDDPDAPRSFDPQHAVQHPVLWADGTMHDLGVFGIAEGCTRAAPCAQGAALDINARGEIVGFSEDSAFARRPFVWRDGTLVDLGVFPGENAVARVINDRGQVAGDGASGAFLWEEGSTILLGSLGGGVTEVTAINAQGDVAGAGLTPDGAQHAFVWVQGRLVDLGLGLSGAEGSKAVAINDRGDVLGIVAINCIRNTHGTCNYAYNRSVRGVLWRRRGADHALTR
jgi:probable HAF family extracellular repeat protein